MRIDNTFLTNLLPTSPGQRSAASEKSAAVVGQDNLLPSASTHVPDPALVQLRQQLGTAPELRPDRLAQVAELLSRGAYLTPEAAARTANALLQAAE